MTTIAYQHETEEIAVDSQLTEGSRICSLKFVKKHTNAFGTWFVTGELCDIDEFISTPRGSKLDIVLNCSAIVVTNSGVVMDAFVSSDRIMSMSVITENSAIGTGSSYAIAAMDFGKSAKEAIEYAMTRDIYTGGEVIVFNTAVTN